MCISASSLILVMRFKKHCRATYAPALKSMVLENPNDWGSSILPNRRLVGLYQRERWARHLQRRIARCGRSSARAKCRFAGAKVALQQDASPRRSSDGEAGPSASVAARSGRSRVTDGAGGMAAVCPGERELRHNEAVGNRRSAERTTSGAEEFRLCGGQPHARRTPLPHSPGLFHEPAEPSPPARSASSPPRWPRPTPNSPPRSAPSWTASRTASS